MKRPRGTSLWILRKAVSPTAIHLPAAPTGSTTNHTMCYPCTRFTCHPSTRSDVSNAELHFEQHDGPPARPGRAVGEARWTKRDLSQRTAGRDHDAAHAPTDERDVHREISIHTESSPTDAHPR